MTLLKRALTRALFAGGPERHTIRGRASIRPLVQGIGRALGAAGFELVRVRASDPEAYIESGHEAQNRLEDAESMVGLRQFDRMQECIVEVLRSGVPGDLLEAGVWRGGMSIFMRGCLKVLGANDRRVWVADSFAGLPTPDSNREVAYEWNAGDMAVSLEQVQANFSRYGLLDDGVTFLKGFFSETLPGPVPQLAILRVDGDLYQSTKDVLEPLYPHLSAGGFAIFDDYQNLPDCRRAIDEYRATHEIAEPIRKIDQRAVYWQKQS